MEGKTTAGGGARVLVADDDEADFELLQALAAEGGADGFTFEHCSDFDAALGAMADDGHDLYVVDYHLGTASGVDLIRAATQAGCRGPKILVTGSSRPAEVEAEAIWAGAVDFASKDSLEPESLVRLLRTTVERHRAFRARGAQLEKLEQTDTALRTILDNADGLIVADRSGVVRFANPAAEELFARADLVGSTVSLPALGSSAARTIERPDGEERYVDVRSSPLIWQGEDCLVGSYRDLTERRRAQEEVRHVETMAAIGRLAGGVAHDFNNLLMGVLGSLEMARTTAHDRTAREAYLREAEATVMRAADLTRRLLRTARRGPVEVRSLDLADVVALARPLLKTLAGDGIELVLPASRGHWIGADGGEIEQILLNLVSNARDVLDGRGRIDVSLATVDGGHRLTVQDSGPGMPEAVRARIFEPFFTTKPVGAGTGLGLSIVYRIVTESGGSLRARSELGQGAAFELWWPAAPAGDAVPEAAKPAESKPRLSGQVLVVDDERTVLKLVATALEQAGLTVTMCGGGGEALEALGAGLRPELVVTDLSMPGVDGFDVAQAARDLMPTVQIVLVTGFADDVLERSPLPDLHLLRKPFRLVEIVALAADLLGPGATD